MTNVLDELEEIAQDLQEAGHTTDSQRVRSVRHQILSESTWYDIESDKEGLQVSHIDLEHGSGTMQFTENGRYYLLHQDD